MNQRRIALLFGSLLVIQVASYGCMNADATATADEEKAYKTRHAEMPKNFSTKPGKYGAFVGEAKSISIGTSKAPPKPDVGAGGTTGSTGGATTDDKPTGGVAR